MAVGRGKSPGPTTRLQCLRVWSQTDPHRSPQIPTNTGRFRQILTYACRPRQIPTLLHCSSRESVVRHNHQASSDQEAKKTTTVWSWQTLEEKIEDGRTVIWVTMPCLDSICKQAWWYHDWRRFEVEFSRRQFPVRVNLFQVQLQWGRLRQYGTYHEGIKSYSLLMNPK